MSKPDDSPMQPDPARVPGWWMDGDAEPDEPLPPKAAMSPGETAEDRDDRASRQAPDQQLVHALLLHLSLGEAAGRPARIDRALGAIRQAAPQGPLRPPQAAEEVGRPRRRARSLIRWAVAASLLVGVATWYYIISSSNSALAALDGVVRAMDDPADRTYEIWVDPVDRPAPRQSGSRPGRGPDSLPPEDRRPGLDGAVLYVRGDQFVLYRSAPGGKLVINGSNGREHWLVRPDRPVLVSSSPGAFRIPMPEDLATVPFVDIRASLAMLRRGYQIEELPAEQLGTDDPTLWRHLRARKIDRKAQGPNAISIWFHPETNIVGQIRFEQMHMQGRPEPRCMTITLTSRAPLPADWFDHQAHHAPDASRASKTDRSPSGAPSDR